MAVRDNEKNKAYVAKHRKTLKATLGNDGYKKERHKPEPNYRKESLIIWHSKKNAEKLYEKVKEEELNYF